MFSLQELDDLKRMGVGFWAKRRLLKARRKPLLIDVWSNLLGQPYQPPIKLRGGGSQSWEECLEATIADGTAVTAAAETIVCPDYNIPAFYLSAGRAIRIYASGIISTVVTTPGTGVWSVRIGGVAGTLLCKSAAQSFHTTAQTNVGWNMTAYLICRSAGSSGTIMSSGQLDCFDVLDTTSSNLKSAVMGSAGTASNVAVTVDTTAAKLLSVTFTQTVATGSLTCQQRIIEVLN